MVKLDDFKQVRLFQRLGDSQMARKITATAGKDGRFTPKLWKNNSHKRIFPVHGIKTVICLWQHLTLRKELQKVVVRYAPSMSVNSSYRSIDH